MLTYGVYGPSDSGKTQLIEEICRVLSDEYDVAVIKNAPEHRELDNPEKDSYRHINSGAGVSMVRGDGATLFSFSRSFSPKESFSALELLGEWDLLLVEGLCDAGMPLIKVGNGAMEKGTIMEHSDAHETIAFLREKLASAPAKPRSSLFVDGKKVPLTDFPMNALASTMEGLLSCLKGVGEGDIRIIIRR